MYGIVGREGDTGEEGLGRKFQERLRNLARFGSRDCNDGVVEICREASSSWWVLRSHLRLSIFPCSYSSQAHHQDTSHLDIRTTPHLQASPPPNPAFRTTWPHATLPILRTMFSVVLPGRLPLPAPQQVDETHCVFPLENASTISHVVVFMTGVQPFPPGFSATVHLLWPSTSGSTGSVAGEWKLLGCLRNSKPSAIFKVTKPNTAIEGAATLGISIEPDNVVDQQLAALQQSNAGALTTTSQTPQAAAGGAEGAALSLAPKIAKNAFAYLSSFAPDSAPQTVPLLQKWLEQLERKLKSQGVAFLDKQE